MKFGLKMTLAFVAAAGVGLALTFEAPPVVSTQNGYRGLGMEQVSTRRAAEAKVIANQMPEVLDPAPTEGPKATSEYTNVQVLTELNVEQFNRLMLAITQWVSPEQGCTYCHVADDLAADTVYTKVVSRRMLQMTKHINASWNNHVGETGVTCFTCHRGQPVPAAIWFTDPGPPQARGVVGTRDGQNTPARSVAYSALPFGGFSTYLERDDAIRVVSTTALPAGNAKDIRDTEATYGLMMHMSDALGVNCTFCHNTRSFMSWDQSTPQRTTSWHGIRMVRDLNVSYLDPLKDAFPAHRLGPLGDVPKVNCGTCHLGAQKPLLGGGLLKSYPELR